MSEIDLARTRNVHLDDQVSRSYRVERNRTYTVPTVLGCGYQKCQPTYRIRRDRFRPFAIEYVVRGSGYVQLGGKRKVLHPGMAFTYGPEPHEYGTDPDDPMEKMHVVFSGEGSGEALLQASGGMNSAFGLTSPGEISDLFRQILAEAASVGKNRREILGGYLRILLLKVEALRSAGREVEAEGVYEAAKARIESDYIELKSAHEVAASLGISVAHVCRLFKRHVGTSPHSMLIQLKLNHAAQQLATTSRSIKEIAYELNFCDPYHFSRSFKKRFGVSPRRFRQEGLA